MIEDTETQIAKVASTSSRRNIRDAYNCYRAGAYRPAIVACWTSVIYDLAEKVQTLAASGEPEAVRLNGILERITEQIHQGNPDATSNALKFERELVDECTNKLGFFDSFEKTELERLREDRHKCAHPSYDLANVPFQPSPELAKMHISSVLRTVLLRPPTVGKAAVEKMVALVKSAAFPNEFKAAEDLIANRFPRIKDVFVRGAVDALFFGYFTVGDPLHRNTSAITALRGLRGIHYAVVHDRCVQIVPKIFANLDEGVLQDFLFILSVDKYYFDLVQPTDIPPLRRVIEESTGLLACSYIICCEGIPNLYAVSETKSRVLEIDDITPHALWTYSPLLRDRAVSLYCRVSSWHQANEFYNRLMLPILGDLTEAQILAVLNEAATGDADLKGSGGFNRFCAWLSSEESNFNIEDHQDLQLQLENYFGV